MRSVNYLAEKNEVVDPLSSIAHMINRKHKMFTAKNGRTHAYYVENCSAGGRYHNKFGIGGPDRSDYYKKELGEETFKHDFTMLSVVDLDNILKGTQQGYTARLLDGLRPLGCDKTPVTVFDLVECSRTGLPGALQLAIRLLDTPSVRCDDLGGLMEVQGWLLEFAKFSIETGLTQRARSRPEATSANFRQPDEWLRSNEVGFAVAGQQRGYFAINCLLNLLPRRIRKRSLKGKHVLKWLANWHHRPDLSRGTSNLYNMFCPDRRNFMDAQPMPPTGDRNPSSAEFDQCYDTTLYTSAQNEEACARRDGVLRDHAMHGGGVLVVERCSTSMVERGGMDMVDYIMSLRPFEDQLDDVESTGVEPRWTAVLDEETGEPLQVLDRIVFLYMEVDTDDELRLVAVIRNPSDMFDSNTKRPHTEEFVSEMCNTAMGMDGLKYFATLLETENAEIVEKIDIRTMPFRDSFSAMMGLTFYYKKFLKLPSKTASLFLQNMMQPAGINLHREGMNGLRRWAASCDLFGEQARAENRQSEEKETGIDRDVKRHRSIVAAGSNGTNLEDCLERMKKATLERITDPKEISDTARYFVRQARKNGL